MDIHNRTFHDKVKKNKCDICGYQVSQKKSLARHKKIVHDGVRFSCRQCNYQATSKGHLAEHKRAFHEGVKYPCGQCNYQATSKGNLAKHKRAFILAGNATIKQQQKEVLVNTKGQYMKEQYMRE